MGREGKGFYDEYMHLWLDLVPEYERQMKAAGRRKVKVQPLEFWQGQPGNALRGVELPGVWRGRSRFMSQAMRDRWDSRCRLAEGEYDIQEEGVSTTMTFGQAVAALTSLNQAGITTATIRPRSWAGQKEGTKDAEGKPLYYAVEVPGTGSRIDSSPASGHGFRSLYTPADVEAYINEVVPLVLTAEFATYQFRAPDGTTIRNQSGGTYWDVADLRRCNFTTTHKGRTVKLSVPAVTE